jgi:putative ABC transport system ATP-binding protein
MIEVRNITKQYGKKDNIFTALSDVSFEINNGESVAILGKSGSGKSTLMHIMSGLDRPTSGEVLIDGRNLFELSAKDIDNFRSSMMGFVFQSFFVQAKETCQDNVSLPLEINDVATRKRQKLINNALIAVELGDKIQSKAGELSGGQKQRLAVARAIVGEPKIIFADEPTGNLDSATGKIIEDLLFGYNRTKGVTLIIVTHDADLAKRCDKQIIIKDGRIEAVRKKAKKNENK